MDIKKLMQQAQKAQEALIKNQKEFNDKEFEYDYKGYVQIKLAGSLSILDIKIKPELVDPDDTDTLTDVIRAAINEAIEKTNKERDALMNSMMPKGMFGR
ncbi:hypothetical protein JM47_03365 [Ureaplasma diversum]|uniref:Nucleoid-associated protein UDIV_0810 n=2 Tax=Ureaplasma diversum TaxID=42094 RepID=A0A084F1K2_9BACT|nr:YbaB/EbfC family nucleoid-associated protein [Ureaplasma diversum]AJQ45569.1 hypothetical protein JM47_03365 [Ureaplasma diversum]KEZ24094.1 Hypothetical protein, putative UPF0133 family [Ureaplasma diversum NCTC 246]